MSTSPNSVVGTTHRERKRQLSPVLGLVPIQAEPSAATNDGATETANNINGLLFELGVEPTLTVQEAAASLRWSYWKARRYFSQVEGICVTYRPKRYKRPYRAFTIPVSIFAREWQKMTGQEPEAAEVIRRRMARAIMK